MKLAIRARDVLRGILPALVDELDSLVNRINFVWNKEHDPDGAHTDITATSLVVGGLTVEDTTDTEVILDEDGVLIATVGPNGIELVAETTTGSADLPISLSGSVVSLQRGMQIPSVAFTSLPTPSTGMVFCIADSTTTTWGATITGGGASTVIGFFNGANWTVMGA